MMPDAFQWTCHPEAEAFLLNILEKTCLANAAIGRLEYELEKHTSTRLFDWIDHLKVNHTSALEVELQTLGFQEESATTLYRVFHHPLAQLPRLAVEDQKQSTFGAALCVDKIADFLMVRGISGWIEGSPFSPLRRCRVSTENETSFWLVERRGGRGIEPLYTEAKCLEKYVEVIEKWKTRPRDLIDEEEAFKCTLKIAEEAVATVGQELAAWIVLECEREYWQSRNSAGQIQYNRQQRLGMGWANHDHHTFRSSRRHFSSLVRLFEILGFHCRERFYAGEEAGWGAQVMEHRGCRLVLFLDVDLAPHELELDFAHLMLEDLAQLGTIGLWCGLHGDSILKAGMHHLEAQFLFETLQNDLTYAGIGMMDPFSSFPYLKQAFTQGEIWPVERQRVQRLQESGKISAVEADNFLTQGAIGSHLENLQRREGYKGFNQKNVSRIIKKTDPRLKQF